MKTMIDALIEISGMCYFVLFEVAEWNEVPVAKDPYLLKRINANAFVVLAEWDVSEVELAVMRGR